MILLVVVSQLLARVSCRMSSVRGWTYITFFIASDKPGTNCLNPRDSIDAFLKFNYYEKHFLIPLIISLCAPFSVPYRNSTQQLFICLVHAVEDLMYLYVFFFFPVDCYPLSSPQRKTMRSVASRLYLMIRKAKLT